MKEQLKKLNKDTSQLRNYVAKNTGIVAPSERADKQSQAKQNPTSNTSRPNESARGQVSYKLLRLNSHRKRR